MVHRLKKKKRMKEKEENEGKKNESKENNKRNKTKAIFALQHATNSHTEYSNNRIHKSGRQWFAPLSQSQNRVWNSSNCPPPKKRFP